MWLVTLQSHESLQQHPGRHQILRFYTGGYTGVPRHHGLVWPMSAWLLKQRARMHPVSNGGNVRRRGHSSLSWPVPVQPARSLLSSHWYSSFACSACITWLTRVLIGYVSCLSLTNCSNYVPPTRFLVSRSNYIQPSTCPPAYFQCQPGYYLDFHDTGTLDCLACNVTYPYGGQFVTQGLSVDDPTSCTWDCSYTLGGGYHYTNGSCVTYNRSVFPANLAGQYGTTTSLQAYVSNPHPLFCAG